MRENKGKNVSMTPEHHAFVEAMVASGQYSTASDVVREALRLLQRQRRRDLLEKWLLESLTPEEEAELGPEAMAKARRVVDRWVEESDASGPAELVDDAWIARLREELEEKISRRPTGS